MELFAPDNLPGVGMGDLASIAAIAGLMGMAATSGMLLAEGALGTFVFFGAALALLAQKRDLGSGVLPASIVLGALVLAVGFRLLLERRAARDAAGIVGTAKDLPETRQVQQSVERRRRWARVLAAVAALVSGAACGVAWAEWNEVPFRLDDAEAFAGLVIGAICAAIGGDAAFRFVAGSLKAGASAGIVGAVVAVAAVVLNAASVYVPFTGAVVVVLAIVLAFRLRRRERATYAGLRILS